MKKTIPLVLIISIFLAIKIANNGIRLSDTNIYFNIAHMMLQGQLPYEDFFFANFPLFAYISSFYYFLTFGNINLFYLTSAIEVAITTLLIYKISLLKTKQYLVSVISSLLYIFSFSILSTSDHQTGVSSASLLGVLAYYFFQKKRFFTCGIFIALTILTKAYFIPIFLSFFCYLLIKKRWIDLRSFMIGVISTGIVILSPFLLLSPGQFIYDIFGFSLTRPAGILKIDIAWFFISRDFLFFILLLFNLVNFRKNLFFSLISLFSILLFVCYQDIYYLYLNFFTPFLCLSFYEINSFINSLFKVQRLVILTIVLFCISINLFVYTNSYRDLQKINDIDRVILTIKKWNPTYLYGYNDFTPALSAILGIPALSNVNDAYVYFFRRGVYNKETLTTQAISTRTIIITQGADYPELGVKQDILDNEILNKEKVLKYCKNILSVPVKAEGSPNRINLFKCY
jgi:hypothetical protein